MINLENVSKKFYDRVTAISSISFNVERGEWVFVTGPSGAGKTTLLNLVFGTLEPSAGNIVVAGIDLSRARDAALRQYRRQVGFVFQNSRLLDHLTVFENVAIPVQVRGFSDTLVEKLVVHTLEQVGMAELADARAGTLSGGEKQKIAFARAFVTKPPIVLADEPTGNLDAKSGALIMDMFRKIHMQGTTILLATHEEMWVRRFPGRRLALDRGVVVEDRVYGARV